MELIIINADDYGLTKSSTLAIIESFKQRLITSTTMCANGVFFEEAVRLLFENNLQNRVGIHINITEGRPITDAIACDSFFCNTEGLFHNKMSRIKGLTKEQSQNLFEEMSAQIEKIIANNIVITHVDSHHHIHTSPNLINIFLKAMKKYDLHRLRLSRNIGNISINKRPIKNTFNLMLKIRGYKTTDLFGSLDDLTYKKVCNRSIELMVHPDYDINNVLIDRTGYDPLKYPIGKPLVIDSDFIKNFKLSSYYEV